jgi:NitT/TauT family transport system substrate-binding protein
LVARERSKRPRADHKESGHLLCPQYVAEELLHAEGFTDIRSIDTPPPEIGAAIAPGKVDFGMTYAAQFVMASTGAPRLRSSAV